MSFPSHHSANEAYVKQHPDIMRPAPGAGLLRNIGVVLAMPHNSVT